MSRKKNKISGLESIKKKLLESNLNKFEITETENFFDNNYSSLNKKIDISKSLFSQNQKFFQKSNIYLKINITAPKAKII